MRTARDRTAALLDEQRMRVVELDRERTRLERELRARHESSERARRRGQAKRDAEREAAPAELRSVEIELNAVAPDAIALLGGFESWRQAPDKWLVEPVRRQRPVRRLRRRRAADAGAARRILEVSSAVLRAPGSNAKWQAQRVSLGRRELRQPPKDADSP